MNDYFLVVPKSERLDRLYKKVSDRISSSEHLRELLAIVYRRSGMPVEPLYQKTHEELMTVLKITLAFYDAHNFDFDELVI